MSRQGRQIDAGRTASNYVVDTGFSAYRSMRFLVWFCACESVSESRRIIWSLRWRTGYLEKATL
jgi:hypothetical protein